MKRVAPELAEATGVFAMLLVGCGAMMVSAIAGAPDHVGIGLSWGLVVGAMIYATGHVSGAHFNPAVTLAFAATGHFPWKRVPAYVASQVVGGLLALSLLWWLFPDAPTYGETTVNVGLSDAQGFVLEVVITAILMFVISSVATDGRAVGQNAGIAIGGTVAMISTSLGALTNASMNPARSLAPALFAGTTDILWLYVLAPVLGAALGAFLYQATRRGDRPTKETP